MRGGCGRGDIPVAVGDAGLARRALGWEPTIPWETTLQDVLADWRVRASQEAAGPGG